MTTISVISAFVALIIAFIICYYAILISIRPYTIRKYSNIEKWKYSIIYGFSNSISLELLVLAIMLNSKSESSIIFYIQCLLPSLILSLTTITIFTRLGMEAQIKTYKSMSDEIKSEKKTLLFKIRKSVNQYLGKEMKDFYNRGYD
jgi:hypothetical protein